MKLTDSILSRLSNQHNSIAELILNVPQDRLHYHPAPGKWSIHDNVAHLARYNVVFQERINRIMLNDGAAFDRYVAELDHEFPSWQSKSTAALLHSIAVEREEINTISKNFSENDLKKTGVHPKFGRLIVAEWLEFFLLHEAHHIFTIFKLKNDVDGSGKVER